MKLFPLSAEEASDVLEGDVLDATPAELLNSPIEGNLRYASLPAWFGASAIKTLENALSVRLPDKLEATLLRDPVTKALSKPGEPAGDFARRIAAESAPAALKEKLEKKRRDLAAAEAQEKGREVEKFTAMATAAVDLLGGLFGKKKTLRTGKVGSVLTKNRMEGAAEAKVEALRAEIADLEAKVAPPDPSRFESVTVLPPKSSVDLLAVGVAWVA